MIYLLDTHTFLWLSSTPQKVSPLLIEALSLIRLMWSSVIPTGIPMLALPAYQLLLLHYEPTAALL